ncbi:MAG TPA: heparin lyase I family protein [Bauldia sp.]|nr:heparin lyase I family protein [Bauldia sp.]
MLSLILSGLLGLGPGSDADRLAPSEGWIAKAIRAEAPEGQDAYQRGYDFGENDVAMLLDAWRVHDAMTRMSMDADLEEVATRTADLVTDGLSADTLREMEGIDDGLNTAGQSTSTEEIIGWNAFMDLSLHWAAKIEDDFPGAESGNPVAVGGTLYTIQTADKSYSLTAPAPDTLRFEVRPGDNWQHDSPRYERSEIAGPVYPADEMLEVTYDLMIEPGEPNQAEWLLIGQFHADDADTPPPLAIELDHEKMEVRARFGHGEGGETLTLYRDETDLERGRYYRMRIRALFPDDEEDEGVVQIWRDGRQIVDYAGPLGYGYGVYWKVGIYRRPVPEALAVNIRNLFVTGEDGLIVAAEEYLDLAD